MPVEKRRRPISTGKTGVIVSCTMAWTAMGKKGVGVEAPVAVAAGDGVITKKVAVAAGGREVSVTVGDVVPVLPPGLMGARARDGAMFVTGTEIANGVAGC